MKKALVIVESPTKAKTIGKFLGSRYKVVSSFGHVRDLPKSKLGVDVEHGFKPSYVVNRDKTAVVKELKAAASKADQVLLATDEDREGEAISFHLAEILGIDPSKAERITFHEITKTAIEAALKHPRGLDLKLVDAQQARRVLDRLVGYELSPLLWRKVAKGLSAGRVQSVAVRLVVEREREIKKFVPQEYWSIEGLFTASGKKAAEFPASLHAHKGKKFDKFDLPSAAAADAILAALQGQTYTVAASEEKQSKRTPPAPFTTSTLQQEANNTLGFSAKQTMRLAQQLYEGIELGSEGHVGLITYMRTDAVNLSEKFLLDAKAEIIALHGDKYALSEPRAYKNKNKNAQEAHEAIRPSEAARTPDTLKGHLEPNQLKLYTLIWKRAVATQMAEAQVRSVSMDIQSANEYLFRATGQNVVFDGFLALYPEKTKENFLPELPDGERITCNGLTKDQHFTEPPARYSDASLVKALEEYGIGRPSTYAPTISTIEDRGYVQRDERKKLFPTDMAFLVNDLLVEHFPTIVDYQFTAELEEDLDRIAEGEKKWQPVIEAFYTPFKKTLELKDKELNKKELTEEASSEVCEKCGKPMVIKFGRFGKFFACTGYPECKSTKPLPGDPTAALPAEYANEKCELCGAPMSVKRGRFGPFLGCSKYPDCKFIKKIEISTKVKCPSCKEGELVQKKSKRGRIFFACNRYPECSFALWNKPTGESCPNCKQPVVYGPKGTVKCSSKECGYSAAAPEPATTTPAPEA